MLLFSDLTAVIVLDVCFQDGRGCYCFPILAAVIVLVFVFKLDSVVAVFRFGGCECVGVCFQDGCGCCCFQI